MQNNTSDKVNVYNLVILDKSGSMSSIRNAAIIGLNETINGIRQAQLQHIETQRHYFSLHTFCSCEQRDVYDCAPIAEVRDITEDDFVPCCCTPLYDAVGISLTKMQQKMDDNPGSIALVTVITDGYENASKRFSGKEVANLISRLREKGWAFAYLGADHDVEAVAKQLNIQHSRCFSHDEDATREVMAHDAKQRMAMCNWITTKFQDDLSVDDYFYDE